MDNDTDRGRQRAFILSPVDKASRKAAFECNALRLLSQSAEDYVAAMDVDRVMAAFHAQADTDGPRNGQADLDVGSSDRAREFQPRGAHCLDVLAASNRKSAACALASTRPADVIAGAHNADALAAGRELVAIAARRPERGIWQLVSGKGGSGKTTLLLHLARIAQGQANMNAAVLDCSATDNDFHSVTGADLVLIDNADVTLPPSRQTDWWASIDRQLSKSACVVIALTPKADHAAQVPWRERLDAGRDTTIGAFDCNFRRELIADMSRRQHLGRGGESMTECCVDRLANELWGNGWQLSDGVDACQRYATVMARQPRPEEIDQIAVNITTSRHKAQPPLAEISRVIARACDQTQVSSLLEQGAAEHQMRRDVAFYLTKAITGEPLEVVGREFDFERDAAVECMLRTERGLQRNHPTQQLIHATLIALDAGNRKPHSFATP